MLGQRLPPLNGLRAFEAAARRLSIKAAAEELSVTPGAVSQLIKSLEARLGVRLFQRINRGLVLSEAGRAYFPPVRNAFRQIAEASQRVAAVSDAGVLALSVAPFFAAAWLIPRLAGFNAAHPEIDVQVSATNVLTDFSKGEIDLAVRHGLGRYPGLIGERILAVEIVPVAAPILVAARGVPKDPAALARWPQIHDAERKAWHAWLQSRGVNEIGAPRGPSFDDPSLLLSAARAGQGAGLFPAAMVAEDLANGSLVKLADAGRLDDFAYYLVYPEAHRGRPKVAAFRAWILETAQRETGVVPPAPDRPARKSKRGGRGRRVVLAGDWRAPAKG
jgi:LysR family transcriptional regulator, glycine cleavage system transcriptional activator